MEPKAVYKITPKNNKVEIITGTRAYVPEQKPLALNISGNIDSVSRWLEKRFKKPEEEPMEFLVSDDSHVLVNRDKMTIELVFNESNPHTKSTITGKLQFHPDFTKWKINTGEEWETKKRAEFVKMNRSSFEEITKAMKVAAELSDLKVNVEKELEKSSDNRGNAKSLVAQRVISSNIPENFTIQVPIFKGLQKSSILVELYINPVTYDVILTSYEANDIVAGVKDTVFDAEIAAIINSTNNRIPIIDI